MPNREMEAVTVQLLAGALDAILTELVEYRLSRPPPTEPIRLAPAPQSPAQRRASLFARMTKDPFEGALLYALRGIGEELFLLGGTSLMQAVLQEVAARDAENVARRLSPADSQWDGIGNRRDCWVS